MALGLKSVHSPHETYGVVMKCGMYSKDNAQ